MHAPEWSNVQHCLHILSPSEGAHSMLLQLPTVLYGKMRQKRSHLLSTSSTLIESAGQRACRWAWGVAGSVLGSQGG